MDVTTIMEQALEIKSYEFTDGNIKTTCEFASNLPPTMVDEHQLLQVFMNILTNAEQAIRVTHGGGQISVRTTALGDKLRVSISNNGLGNGPWPW